MDALSDKYKDRGVEVIIVYIKEAHAQGDWGMGDGINADWQVSHSLTLADRMKVASDWKERQQPTCEVYVDSLADQGCIQYQAHPERLFVVDTKSGNVVFQGGEGPFFYEPKKLDEFLEGRV